MLSIASPSIPLPRLSLRTIFQKMARPLIMLGVICAVPSDTPQPPTKFEQLAAKTCAASETQSSPVYIAFTGGQGRVPEALRLYNRTQDQKPTLYISGIGSDVSVEDVLTFYDHEFLIPEIRRSIFHDHAETTNANAIQSVMFLKEHCFSNVTLVTSDYHMERARFVFERALRNIHYDPDMSYVSVDAPPLTQHELFEETIKRRAVEFFSQLDAL